MDERNGKCEKESGMRIVRGVDAKRKGGKEGARVGHRCGGWEEKVGNRNKPGVLHVCA